jgi:hypothetical protein
MAELDPKANIKDGTADKFDGDWWDKPDLTLIPREPVKECARVLEKGARKYDRHNWRKGTEWSRFLRAAKEHIDAFIDGEDRDEDTGTIHLANAVVDLMFVMEYMSTHPELDNRYNVKEGKVNNDT